ncbi:MAG: hypothetical protein FE78DRAFT_389961 [Acidomyces sp. 'richmondensis']|nr:MAG: hypothetical protein FE78DRAFT_389961 [Acidomyces sp. 'richmondensis']
MFFCSKAGVSPISFRALNGSVAGIVAEGELCRRSLPFSALHYSRALRDVILYSRPRVRTAFRNSPAEQRLVSRALIEETLEPASLDSLDSHSTASSRNTHNPLHTLVLNWSSKQRKFLPSAGH